MADHTQASRDGDLTVDLPSAIINRKQMFSDPDIDVIWHQERTTSPSCWQSKNFHRVANLSQLLPIGITHCLHRRHRHCVLQLRREAPRSNGQAVLLGVPADLQPKSIIVMVVFLALFLEEVLSAASPNARSISAFAEAHVARETASCSLFGSDSKGVFAVCTFPAKEGFAFESQPKSAIVAGRVTKDQEPFGRSFLNANLPLPLCVLQLCSWQL